MNTMVLLHLCRRPIVVLSLMMFAGAMVSAFTVSWVNHNFKTKRRETKVLIGTLVSI